MTTPALPNLTFTVTPPGGIAVDFTDNLAYDGGFSNLTITQNFGRQGDTATFVLVDEYANNIPNIAVIPVFSQVKLTDNALGQVLFAGVVNDPQLQIDGPTRSEWVLNCTDYTFYADNSTPVIGLFNNLTAGDIIVSLTEQANCGISAALIQDGGFVSPGPYLPSVNIGYQELSSAWKQLATLAGQVTPFGWYVDENRELHFYDSTTALYSNATFTTTPGAGFSTTEGHIAPDSTQAYEWDGTTVHNRILVQGSSQQITVNAVTQLPVDTYRGDGITTAWPLRFTFSSVVQLTVNGVVIEEINIVPPGSPNSAGNEPSASWNIIQNNINAYFLTANSAPGAGTIIRIWYNYNIPIVVQVNDIQSQDDFPGPNGGIFGEFISDTSLTTTAMALARAQRERQEYAFPVERFTFNTTEDFWGWVRAGYTFNVVDGFIPDSERAYARGINDLFLCIQNQITFTQGGYRTMQLTGVRI